MGADFLFATFPQFKMTQDRKIKFQDLIANLSENEQNDFLEWFCMDEAQLEGYDLIEDIEEACSIDINREISTLSMHDENGNHYYENITGGMSWGDSPTDAYDNFCRAVFFDEIYGMALDFSIEDCKVGSQ